MVCRTLCVYNMKKTILRNTLFALLSAAFTGLAAEAVSDKLPPPSDKTGVTYEKDIKAIFDKSCLRCHGEQKPKAKLRMDSLAGILKGGEDGKVVIAGNSAKSPLVAAVARVKEDEAMPPEGKGKPLTKEQVGLIRSWIDQGAK